MIVLASAPLAVAAVLLGAALGKIRDVRAFAATIEGYRVLPARLALPAAVAVLVVEVVAAALLMVPVTRLWAAVAAVLLFAVFLGAMGSVLRRGLSVGCGCFGGRDLVGPGTMARTGVLLVLALMAVAAGPAPFAPLQVPVAAALLGVAFGLPLLVPGRGRHGPRGGRASGAAGTRGPLEHGPRPGTPFALEGAPERTADRVLYALVSPGCGLCTTMLPHFTAMAARMEVVLVSAAPKDGSFGADGPPLVVDPDVYDRNDILWPPYAVVTDRGGTVLAAGGAADPAQLQAVLDSAATPSPS
ncbi:MauE/DoxX family redox-associated membrane protein [Nonomuraea roseoviolacea]|uniref:Membrane protein YphA (DoxX/SURF4 family) n=1 Tax=Nonomuraea roseoviolacea subsp. carminata TaxID=160689 RepID=A0ABT1K0G7_9ACTN|nr:MauE/DoxX family redox-associated membrane protein [Nonomuraea roseoviolacea]MCP2347492.1 putative membrane protein YphA (DoxX/SURF4 family) [Nonomuraea roseoviolacea subsp. carminata]